jgi:GH18 family chitinase
MIASLLAAVGVVGATPSAHAAIEDRPAYTWNMQGATEDGTSKWDTYVGPRVGAPGQPVVALQEVGPGPPPSAPNTTREVLSGDQLAPLPDDSWDDNLMPDFYVTARQVIHTQWASGGVNRHVYFLQTDANADTWAGGRVNLAIVTTQAAEEVVIIPTPLGRATGGALRPALGVLVGDTWYFTIHGASGSGGDIPGLLNRISDFIQFRQSNYSPDEQGLVLGDFNREPPTLSLPPTVEILPPTQPTHNGVSYFDYAVMIDPSLNFPGGMAAQTDFPNPTPSDHAPVLVEQLNATPTPTPSAVPIYASSRVIESMQSGGVLDVTGDATANLSPIDSYRRNGKGNQAWTVLAYPDGSLSFKGDGGGRCIDITNSGQNPGSGTGLSLWDCSDQASQRWMPDYLGDGEFELESVLLPGLCMNISNAQSDPNIAAPAILYPCANVANERFYFAPAYPSALGDNNPGNLRATMRSPAVVESMLNGGAMDVANQGTANNTEVDSWARTGDANQGWDLVWHADGSFSFQSESSGRCLDIHNSTTVTAGRDMVLWDCTGQASQDFVPIPMTDDQFYFQNVQEPDLCLETVNATADPASGYEAVNPCNPITGQEYILTPFDPTGTPSPPNHDELFTVPTAPNAAVPAQRVGYYTSWSTYANAFYPKNLDTQGIAGKLTTLNYAFENIDPVNLTCMEANKPSSADESDPNGNDGSSDAYADYQKEYTSDNSVDGTSDTWSQPLRGNFNQLRELKAKYPNLKILVSIGGWTYSKFFSDVAATDASRKKFVASCIDMYVKGNLPQVGDDPAGGPGAGAGIFDGFDIDWEFPGSGNGHLGNHVSAQDGANYTALLQEFRTELDALGGPHYMLTAALPAGPTEIANLNIPSIAGALDLGDVMTYDFHGAFETTGPANFQAPLYDAPASPAFGTGFTANDAIDSYIASGFPSAKLTLGVPFYARGWTGVPDGGQYGRYQTATGPTAAFPLSQEAGVADWKELEAAGLTGTTYYDADSESTWIYDGTNFYSTETPFSLAVKRQYIQQMNLGGVMMYSLEADDSSSTLLNAATGLSP